MEGKRERKKVKGLEVDLQWKKVRNSIYYFQCKYPLRFQYLMSSIIRREVFYFFVFSFSLVVVMHLVYIYLSRMLIRQ